MAVMVTTDKVYLNNEWHYPYREVDVLGGHDPYSAIKAAGEIVIASYRDAVLEQQGIAIATARAVNVIGRGDWSQDRLIPDAVHAWQTPEPLVIRRLQAIRPCQHVLEPLHGYLTLAQKLWHRPALPEAYNFAPQRHETATVRTVIEQARPAFGSGKVSYVDGITGSHEAGWSALEIAKVREIFGITPKWLLVETVQRTIAQCCAHLAVVAARSVCESGIAVCEASLENGSDA